MNKPATPVTPVGAVRHGELIEPGGRRRDRRRDRPAERRTREVGKPANIRLWLPLTPLWIILAPFAILLAPLITLAPRLLPANPQARALREVINANPYRAAFALGSVLLSMSGLVVHVEAPDAHIHIRIL